MAEEAIRGRTGILPARMTLGATRGDVCSGPGEVRKRMIKARVIPISGVVALLAGCRIASRHMVWIGGAVEVRLMTGHALARLITVGTSGVTLIARATQMRARQRKRGRRVIKVRIPVRSAVTQIAGLREARVTVIGITCTVEISNVTICAGRRKTIINAADVTLGATRGDVCAGQREARERMIKARVPV